MQSTIFSRFWASNLHLMCLLARFDCNQQNFRKVSWNFNGFPRKLFTRRHFLFPKKTSRLSWISALHVPLAINKRMVSLFLSHWETLIFPHKHWSSTHSKLTQFNIFREIPDEKNHEGDIISSVLSLPNLTFILMYALKVKKPI